MIALYVFSVAWFILAALLAEAIIRQGDRHTHERELWRAERQILQARSLKPYPSERRPVTHVNSEADSHDHKLTELKRLAGVRPIPEEPATHIVPTDL